VRIISPDARTSPTGVVVGRYIPHPCTVPCTSTPPGRAGRSPRSTCRGSGTDRPMRRVVCLCVSLNRVTSPRALPHPTPAVPSRFASRNRELPAVAALRYWAARSFVTRPAQRDEAAHPFGLAPRGARYGRGCSAHAAAAAMDHVAPGPPARAPFR
jgi:hypothetical protein